MQCLWEIWHVLCMYAGKRWHNGASDKYVKLYHFCSEYCEWSKSLPKWTYRELPTKRRVPSDTRRRQHSKPSSFIERYTIEANKDDGDPKSKSSIGVATWTYQSCTSFFCLCSPKRFWRSCLFFFVSGRTRVLCFHIIIKSIVRLSTVN